MYSIRNIPAMFAKSETLPIFVLPKIRNYQVTEYILDCRDKASFLCGASISDSCGSLARLHRRLASLFCTYNNFQTTMPKTPESAQAVKYSNGGTHSIHTFRVKIHSYYSFDDGHRDEYTLDTVVYATSRTEAIGKAIITASAIHPNYDIRPLSFGGYRICEQLD